MSEKNTGREEREIERGRRGGFFRQGLPPLSILCKIEFNHRRHHHRASMGMYVKTKSRPSPFFSWCRSGRPAPVRRGVLSFYGGGVVTLSLLCRFDSVSLWGNCSRFGFPFFTFFDELIEGFHRILPVSVSSCSWKTSTSSLFFFFSDDELMNSAV